jgi:hypothetical protein
MQGSSRLRKSPIFPISDYARRIYKSGPSILQRTLPFSGC